MRLTRNILLLVVVILIVSSCSRLMDATQWAPVSLATSAPEEQSADAEIHTRVQRESKSKMYGYIDSFVLIRDGYLLVSVTAVSGCSSYQSWI